VCTDYTSPRACDPEVLSGRRGFLKATAAAVAVAASAGLSGTAVAGPRARRELPAVAAGRLAQAGEPRRVPHEAISYQLYTASSQLSADVEGTLRALAAIGFPKVEHAGHAGRTPNGFRAALDGAGLTASSGHSNVPFPYDEAAWKKVLDDAVVVGQRAVVEPLPRFAVPGLIPGQILSRTPIGLTSGVTPGLAWQQFAHTLNRAAAVAAPLGISVGYHNHDVEFAPLPDMPGRTAFDVLLAETDPALVHFEMDLYWVTFAGADPVRLLSEHPTRFRRLHVKDMAADGSITAPGTGVIDFARIFRAAADAGAPIVEYIVEQDNAGAKALETAQLGFDLLSRVEF
jgi:sugar phosphate isomerase/epimerase